MTTAKSQWISIVLHVCSIALIIAIGARPRNPRPPDANPIVELRLAPPKSVKTGPQLAGGSNQTALAPKHGAPPRSAHRVFIPPSFARDPKLAIPVSVDFDSPKFQIELSQIGDPLSAAKQGMFGQHGANGIGDRGCCQGIGEEREGRPGIAVGRAGHEITQPRLMYEVDPEFSEEARKAKYQGVVVLAIEIDADGKPGNVRVIQGLGLGLDERAIAAVLQWRFRPGLQDGKPVVTAATVQVNFRLL
jgi:TonB family protein